MRTIRCGVCLVSGVWFLAGCALFDRAETKTTAVKDQPTREQIENAKPVESPRIQPETHLAAGRMLEEQGEQRAAIRQYEKAIAASPRTAAGYNSLGMLYQKLGRGPDAELIYRRGLQIAPNSAVLRNNLGYCYLTQERFAEAEQQFREALSSAPDFKRARMNLAITLAHAGKDDESLHEFGAVVSPDAAYYNLAMIRMGQRDYRGAESALLKALVINADCPDAAAQLKKVRILALGGGQPPPMKAVANQGHILAGGGEEANQPKTGD